LILTFSDKKLWKLTESGKDSLANGTPEFRIVKAIVNKTASKDEIIKASGLSEDNYKLGFAAGMRKKWFSLKDGIITKEKDDAVDDEQK